jgi:hypothetical protein
VNRPRFVDTGNPALGIPCPRCGLQTARFMEFCRNCGYALWPSVQAASRAFKIWRAADPDRKLARPYDLEIPKPSGPPVVDFDERAHELGIHVFPSSVWPFPICVGLLFLGLAAVPFAAPVRIGCAAFGAIVFLVSVIGWVVVEDTRIYPASDPGAGHSPEH